MLKFFLQACFVNAINISNLVDQLAIVSATLGKQADPHMNTKNRSLTQVLQADQVNAFPVWLQNLLLSTGLEPVLSQTEKLCIASNYRQSSTNIKIKIIKLIPFFLAPWGRRF